MEVPGEAEVWRVYVMDWVTVYTSHARGEAGKAECQGWVGSVFQGNRKSTQVRVAPVNPSDPGNWQFSVRAWLLNLVYEGSGANARERAAEYPGTESFIRHSPEEKRRLAQAGWPRP